MTEDQYDKLILSNNVFNKIRDFFYKKSGIVLGDNKEYLIANRLTKFVGPDRQYKRYEDFYDALEKDRSGFI